MFRQADKVSKSTCHKRKTYALSAEFVTEEDDKVLGNVPVTLGNSLIKTNLDSFSSLPSSLQSSGKYVWVNQAPPKKYGIGSTQSSVMVSSQPAYLSSAVANSQDEIAMSNTNMDLPRTSRAQKINSSEEFVIARILTGIHSLDPTTSLDSSSPFN